MRFIFSGKIAKRGKYLTSSDDVRLIKVGNKWSLVGFAHNPDGQDIKPIKFEQHGDHYGLSSVVSGVLIDTPQFIGTEMWESLEEARKALNEGVPLNITFDFLDNKSYGECQVYELKGLEEE